MNAPANIFPPHLLRHVESVKTFIPGCHGKELELRCRLMSFRDSASIHVRNCSDEAVVAVQEIQRLAVTHALAPVSVKRLEALHTAMRSLVRAATLLDEFAEGDGARG